MRMLRLQTTPGETGTSLPACSDSRACFVSQPQRVSQIRDGGWEGQGERRQRGVYRQTHTIRTVSQEECRQCQKTLKQFSNPGKKVCSLGWHDQCGGCKRKVIGANPPPAQDILCWSQNLKESQVEKPLEISEASLSFEFPGDSAAQTWVYP